ncbi:MAG TPA: 4a-hydroxytetrahydrobiopterin dehydratase [Salinisphaeraceae bacterium]|nr:4a-hydroxytetrahydrobiopterin dehydratase [Salinisphaeraceae bacterium]
MSDLAQQHCAPCEGGTEPMQAEAVGNRMTELSDHWSQADGKIAGAFKFKNYYQTQAFVNAIAWLAHREDHHPDITFGYNNCRVELTTHAIGGLSDNDFIMAAKIDRLLT